MHSGLRLMTVTALGVTGAAAVLIGAATAAPRSAPAALSATPAPWPMFHRDERHTGVITASVGNFIASLGPVIRWQYRVVDQPATEADLPYYRWATTFPLGDLDGDGTLEIIVTSPVVGAPVVPTLDGTPVPDRVIALKDAPGQIPPVQVMWVYTSSFPPGQSNFDTYSPALADVDGDGQIDQVIFTSADNYVRALDGLTGQEIWKYGLGRITEAGAMLADLNGDGTQEAIVVTACQSGTDCPGPAEQAHLVVLPITATGSITQPL